MKHVGRLTPKVFVVLALGLAGCHPNELIRHNPANQADPNIARSFGVALSEPAPEGSVHVDRARVSIQKSAFEKEFLLQTNMSTQKFAPMFGGQQSRIVFFRQRGDKLYLIEASQGLRIAKDYPQTLALTEFNILEDSADAVIFDFNSGMARVALGEDWHARDFGSAFPTNYTLRTSFSYIDRANLISDKFAEVRQNASIEFFDGLYYELIPVEVTYYLSPYAPNPNFTPSIAPKTLDHAGYFEARRQTNDEGGYVSYAAKVDVKKPVVYAISANTPKAYHDAIRDGILYWNRAFKKDLVQVVDAPEGTWAPDPQLNLVQWVDWDNAGFAYADAQLDPRSGEILHQQIFFTSAWALIGKTELQDFGRAGTSHAQLAIQNLFKTRKLCDLDLNQKVTAGLADVLRNTQDPAKILKASQDLIREVVAHEVGHTLGLRHNFAGSLAANYAVDTREELFKNYLSSGAASDSLITSSSVMDYQHMIEAMLNGDQIARGSHVGEYDEKAIQQLYFDHAYKATEMPLFCTDSQTDTYVDCQRYDAGNSYIAWLKYDLHHTLDLVPYQLLRRYIAAKAPLFGEPPREVAEVQNFPDYRAMVVLDDMINYLSLLNPEARLLSVERQFASYDGGHNAAIRRQTNDIVQADLNRNGSLAGVLVQASKPLTLRLEAEFNAYLERPEIIRGANVEGKPYEFTPDELRVMKNDVHDFFARFELELARTEVTILGGHSAFEDFVNKLFGFQYFSARAAEPYDDTPLARDFAKYLRERAKAVIMAVEGAPNVFKRAGKSEWILPGGIAGESKQEDLTYTLPHFSYPLDLRKKAADLLSPARSASPRWGVRERLSIGNEFATLVTTALPGVNLDDSSALENFPDGMVDWIVEAREIRNLVGTSISAPVVVKPGETVIVR